VAKGQLQQDKFIRSGPTRRQRVDAKLLHAKVFPLRIATVNFRIDENLGFVIRAAACFGAEGVDVIGHLPKHHVLKNKSGSTVDYLDIKQYSNPESFLIRSVGRTLVAAELHERAVSLHNFQWPTGPVTIIVGHEAVGVPTALLLNSQIVEVPMPGMGVCLNTSQAANVLLYDYTLKRG